MSHRLVIDYFDDGSISVVTLPAHRTDITQLEIGIDAYYDMEEEWQHPSPEELIAERIDYYAKY